MNQIQLRFLHFNQHSMTLLGIYMRHSAYKRENYTFINANIKVINTILKVNRDNRQTLQCKHYSLTFVWRCLQFNNIPGHPRMDKTNINALVQSNEHFLHLIYKNRFSIALLAVTMYRPETQTNKLILTLANSSLLSDFRHQNEKNDKTQTKIAN